MQLTRVAFVVLLACTLARPAVAAKGELPPTPCQAYAQSTIVFSGTLLKVSTEPAPRVDLGREKSRALRVVPRDVTVGSFRVDEILLGSLPARVRVVLSNWPRDSNERAGERFVVYANAPPAAPAKPADDTRRSKKAKPPAAVPPSAGTAELPSALRVVPVDNAADDLAYLKSARGRGASVSGYFRRFDFDAGRTKTVELPVPGASVTFARGRERFTARTGADGAYLLPNLAPGRYAVSTVPAAQNSALVDATIDVPERGCATASFTVFPRATVSGRVVLSDGSPVERAQLAIVPSGGPVTNANYWIRTTDASGRFRFEGVPAGDYHLGVEITSPTYATGDYGPVYYPGVPERSDARVIRVAPDAAVDAGTLRIEARAVLIGFSGRVTHPNNPTPERVTVSVRNVRAVEGGDRTFEADRSGRFIIELHLGETYAVEARVGALASERALVTVKEYNDELVLELAP